MDNSEEPTERETLLEFPCVFPIKVMGKAADDFDAFVYQIVRRHVEDLAEGAVKMRDSREGNYVAVTVTIEAQSQRQLDNIYLDLTAEQRIIMAL